MELLIPLRGIPRLSEAQQIDFIDHMNDLDLPPHILMLYQGDQCVLMRNIVTSDGLVKSRLCSVRAISDRIVFLRLDDRKEIVLP
jgi:hypothetical protein